MTNVAPIDVATGADLRPRSRPGLVLGQAVGRWGTYFNEEFFGRPSDLAWAIRIAPEDGPTEFADVTSFYPTFLYESL